MSALLSCTVHAGILRDGEPSLLQLSCRDRLAHAVAARRTSSIACSGTMPEASPVAERHSTPVAHADKQIRTVPS